MLFRARPQVFFVFVRFLSHGESSTSVCLRYFSSPVRSTSIVQFSQRRNGANRYKHGRQHCTTTAAVGKLGDDFVFALDRERRTLPS
jgi:hypothetical protein